MKSLLGLLMISASAEAGQTYISVGPTLTGDNNFGNKIGSIGYNAQFTDIFDYQLEAGTFSSLTGTQTVYSSAQLGLTIKSGLFFTRVFSGPSIVTATNQYISSPIQIQSDLEVGIIDERGVSFAVDFMHF